MKKILAIDDQELILMSLEFRLTELGYDVKSANNAKEGIELFNSYEPDLVIVDINMPDMPGTEVVKYIRTIKNSSTPVMILSGNTDKDIIANSFDIGIEDYMEKPVSLDEIYTRVKRLIGDGNEDSKPVIKKNDKAGILQKACVGVVIPCYNEEKRLLSQDFIDLVHSNLEYHLCFVNDGSTDNTLEVLETLKKSRGNNISVYNYEKNGGKAEAVRQGVLHLLNNNPQLDYIGFLDAGLFTDFADFEDLVKTIESTDFKIVSGSRISRMGTSITRKSARQIIGKAINLIVQKTLRIPFKDTQCGAKIMDKEIVDKMFRDKFITKWLLDVEIFMRMKNHYGRAKAKAMICEQPLKRWSNADRSKLSMRDSVNILGQLTQIAFRYNN
ncbi:response regulator [Leptobacterium flavescens]|uniref:dolichyl-phosphate beta-glucosyltransferase n=1 Tax=Leptobacterium flavescens TaxID=472055 RepID=A0A6P0UHP7_9FLAO|nr:response regulator [Leptobacterium flavescens]NER12764.1 response regulator [Leptobacterium flavescens]